MLVLQSVQQRKLTSILINHKKLPAFSYVISPVFYTLFLYTSVRMADVLSSYCFVSVGFCCSGACQCVLQFRRLTSHFCFVHQFLFFFPPLFFSATFISNRRGKCLPSIFTVIQLFSIANFKQCWVISPYFSRFPPFQNSHHTPFPLPSPKPLPVLPPPILPSSRPRSKSTKFFVYFRSACTVNPLLFRSCLEVFFGSPLNVPVRSPLSRQKYA